MDKYCHGFSADKLLAVSCLYCVNCRLNPNRNTLNLNPCLFTFIAGFSRFNIFSHIETSKIKSLVMGIRKLFSFCLIL